MSEHTKINLIENIKPKFSDFFITKLGYVSISPEKLYNKDDYVMDEHGIAGQVRIVNEEHGNFIVFVDGHSDYDKNLNTKKIKVSGEKIFKHQKLQFELLIKFARIMNETLSEFFPYTFMFNNGENMWVRGSTMKEMVRQYTSRTFNKNTHSYFSAKLTPRYTCEIEVLNIKKNLRNSWFSRELIKSMFIDIDLNLSGDTRIKWIVSDTNDYNKKHWDHVLRQYSKFKIDYKGKNE